MVDDAGVICSSSATLCIVGCGIKKAGQIAVLVHHPCVKTKNSLTVHFMQTVQEVYFNAIQFVKGLPESRVPVWTDWRMQRCVRVIFLD